MGAAPPRRPPSATYRLQLNRAQTFDDVARTVPYLHALGISDVYLSPVFRARPDSPHGYDVVDHSTLNPELGGEEGFARLAQVLSGYGMGTILDVVPNHMDVSTDDNLYLEYATPKGNVLEYASSLDATLAWLDGYRTRDVRARHLGP